MADTTGGWRAMHPDWDMNYDRINKPPAGAIDRGTAKLVAGNPGDRNLNQISNLGLNSAGAPPPPPPAPGGGTPAWWRPYSYSGAYDPNAELAMTINNLLPYMSPQSAYEQARYLAQQDKAFADYNNLTPQSFGQEGPQSQQGAFISAPHAQQEWQALQSIIPKGKSMYDLGPAMPWLKSVLDTMTQFAPPTGATGTGAERRTRSDERAMQNQLNVLFSQAQSSPDLQPYVELARNLVAPTWMNAPIGNASPIGFRESAYQGTPYQVKNNYVLNPKFV